MNWFRRVGILLLGTLVIFIGATSGTSAEPTTPTADASQVANWPTELKQIIAGTDEFKAAPWFQGECATRGGDLGMYLNAFSKAERQMYVQLAKDELVSEGGEAALNAPSWLRDGSGAMWATVAEQLENEIDTFPNGDPLFDFPTGYCADTIRSWTAQSDTTFGFVWAKAPDEVSYQKMANALPGPYGDFVDSKRACESPDYLECGKAYFVDCSKAAAGEVERCYSWNWSTQMLLNGLSNWHSANKSFGDRINDFISVVIPAAVYAGGHHVADGLKWLVERPAAVIAWAAAKGMEQVVKFVIAGTVWLWGVFTSWSLNFTKVNVSSGGFMMLYNIVAGIALILSFLVWLLAWVMAIARSRSLMKTALGGLRAVLAIQLIPVGAFLMNELGRQATQALVNAYTDTLWSQDFTAGLLTVNPALGMIAAALMFIGILLAFVMLLFQAPLVYGYAIFGALAAVGQALEDTNDWLKKWIFNLISLCWTPFVIIGMSILGQSLMMPIVANTNQNIGQQIASVLFGALILVMLPLCPWLVSKMMSFTVGHVSAAGDKMVSDMARKAGKSGAAQGGEILGDAAKEGMNALATSSPAAWVKEGISAVTALASNMQKMAAGSDQSSGDGQDDAGQQSNSEPGAGLDKFVGRAEKTSNGSDGKGNGKKIADAAAAVGTAGASAAVTAGVGAGTQAASAGAQAASSAGAQAASSAGSQAASAGAELATSAGDSAAGQAPAVGEGGAGEPDTASAGAEGTATAGQAEHALSDPATTGRGEDPDGDSSTTTTPMDTSGPATSALRNGDDPSGDNHHPSGPSTGNDAAGDDAPPPTSPATSDDPAAAAPQPSGQATTALRNDDNTTHDDQPPGGPAAPNTSGPTAPATSTTATSTTAPATSGPDRSYAAPVTQPPPTGTPAEVRVERAGSPEPAPRPQPAPPPPPPPAAPSPPIRRSPMDTWTRNPNQPQYRPNDWNQS